MLVYRRRCYRLCGDRRCHSRRLRLLYRAVHRNAAGRGHLAALLADVRGCYVPCVYVAAFLDEIRIGRPVGFHTDVPGRGDVPGYSRLAALELDAGGGHAAFKPYFCGSVDRESSLYVDAFLDRDILGVAFDFQPAVLGSGLDFPVGESIVACDVHG